MLEIYIFKVVDEEETVADGDIGVESKWDYLELRSMGETEILRINWLPRLEKYKSIKKR